MKYGDLDLGTKEVRFNIVPVGTCTAARRTARRTPDEHAARGRPGEAGRCLQEHRPDRDEGKVCRRAVHRRSADCPAHQRGAALAPGRHRRSEILTRITENATYTVKGKVNYEGRETDAQEFSFTIGDDGGTSALTWALIVAGIAAAIVGMGTGGWMVRRRWLAAR